MKIKQIVEGIYGLPLGNVNAYLLETGQGLVLIDTGAPGAAPRILEGIRSIGREPSDLTTILLSHCHPDHAGSTAALKREVPSVKIYISGLERPVVEKGRAQRRLTRARSLN